MQSRDIGEWKYSLKTLGIRPQYPLNRKELGPKG
jgi:hypothetical protein